MTNSNVAITDPLKDTLLKDKMLDLILTEVIKDPVYIQSLSSYDSGKMERDHFIKILNNLVLEYRNKM
jgi:hypothetical protein